VLRRIVTAIAAAVTGAVLVAAPASATTEGWDSCPYGRACLFSGANGSGGMWYPLGCGYVNLWNYNVGDWARSLRTSGNTVTLHRFGDQWTQLYSAWGEFNFGTGYAAAYDEMTVNC
jgi:hypothetical protein